MCGIVVIIDRTGSVDLQATLSRGLQALSARGPDGEGAWFDVERGVALGHRRLAIIAPHEGAQPLIAPSVGGETSCVAVVNGEFYGYEELREREAAHGYVFSTRSDSELLLPLYLRHQGDLSHLRELRGEFSYALWDHAQGRVVAARDRFGIKPLFYAQEGETLYLASEPKAILAMGFKAEWDLEAVYDSFHALLPPQRTLFAGIQQVPPGHVLTYDERGLALREYWSALLHRAEGPQTLESAWGELERSVALRTRADVPIGCYLSGGIDSTTVLALASQAYGRPIPSFTVRFDEPSLDESALASQAARFVGAPFEVVHVTQRDFADSFEDTVRSAEMFFYNCHSMARFLLAKRVASSGIKVVLGGEGGDEAFLGYHFLSKTLHTTLKDHEESKLKRVMRAAQRARGLLSLPTSMERSLFKISPRLAITQRLFELPDELQGYLLTQMMANRQSLSDDALYRFKRRDPLKALFSSLSLSSLRRGDPTRRMLQVWLRTAFSSYVLAGERLDMAHGVELRLPFLDHVFFETISSLTPDQLCSPLRSKDALRTRAEGLVPPEVIHTEKRPFIGPQNTASRGAQGAPNPLYELISDLLHSQELSHVPFLNPRAVSRLVAQTHQGGGLISESPDPILYMLASLVVLGRAYRL